MGMFDEVVVEVPLPVLELRGRMLQTKSLDCRLDRYTIDAEGVLSVERYIYGGRKEFEEARLSNVSGEMELHTFVGDDEDVGGLRGYFEFSATFEDGKLTGPITLLSRPKKPRARRAKPKARSARKSADYKRVDDAGPTMADEAFEEELAVFEAGEGWEP
jgi:hypothetical protein